MKMSYEKALEMLEGIKNKSLETYGSKCERVHLLNENERDAINIAIQAIFKVCCMNAVDNIPIDELKNYMK